MSPTKQKVPRMSKTDSRKERDGFLARLFNRSLSIDSTLQPHQRQSDARARRMRMLRKIWTYGGSRKMQLQEGDGDFTQNGRSLLRAAHTQRTLLDPTPLTPLSPPARPAAPPAPAAGPALPLPSVPTPGPEQNGDVHMQADATQGGAHVLQPSLRKRSSQNGAAALQLSKGGMTVDPSPNSATQRLTGTAPEPRANSGLKAGPRGAQYTADQLRVSSSGRSMEKAWVDALPPLQQMHDLGSPRLMRGLRPEDYVVMMSQ